MLPDFFLKPYMSRFLYENHGGSPTLNVLGVLGVLNVLHVLNMPMDASFFASALFYSSLSSLTETTEMTSWHPKCSRDGSLLAPDAA